MNVGPTILKNHFFAPICEELVGLWDPPLLVGGPTWFKNNFLTSLMICLHVLHRQSRKNQINFLMRHLTKTIRHLTVMQITAIISCW